MPPKFKVTREDIINSAVELVRAEGADNLNARNLAARLGISTQPIFSNFASMQELKLAVVEKADTLCNEYMLKEEKSGKYPIYKASGMAYIRFAREEKELFKLLYMRDRSDEAIPENSQQDDKMSSIVESNTGLDDTTARLFHLEMWAYVHGIAVMLATGFFDIDTDLASRMLTDCYQGLLKQFGGKQ